MKLEPGRYYRTRDGRKAFVCAEMNNPFVMGSMKSSRPYRGYIDGRHNVHCWYANGRLDLGNESDGDLISEWKEPETVVRWVNLYRDRDGSLQFGDVSFLSREQANMAGTSRRVACKRIEITEGEFDD